MCGQQQKKIKLQEFLTEGTMLKGRVWNCLGIHIDVRDIPKKSTDHKTIVRILYSGRIAVGVEWKIEKHDTVLSIGRTAFCVEWDIEKDEMHDAVVLVNQQIPSFDGPYTKIVETFSSPEELQNRFPQLFKLEGYM